MTMFCPLSTFFWRKSFKMEAIYCLSYFPLWSVCNSPKLHQLRLLPTLASFACHTWLVAAATAVLSGMSVFKSSFVKDSPCAQWAWTCGLECCQGAHRMSARHHAEGEQHPLWSQPICKLLVVFFFCGRKLPTAFVESFWCQHWLICYVVPDLQQRFSPSCCVGVF